MKTFVLAIMGILCCRQLLFAQRDNANLLVQSPDGKTVKLVWFFKSWNSDITGFDIKRKEGLQDWVKLNNEPILPGVSVKKKLSVVDADINEERELKAKLFKLLEEHKISETDESAYLQKLNSDDKAVQEISDVIAKDYDVALISGFAYVDHSVTNKTDYQYGLFIEGTDILLDSVIWNYGQIPDLNAVTEITSKATTNGNGIQVMWKADINKMREGDVAGFNIYREGIRLNASPIAANDKVPSEFTWYDRTANGKNMAQYSISAESIFGIEGIIKPYTYNPADHPSEYKKAEVTEVTSLGYYFKEGISVKWMFPQESERFLKGFYVEKDNMPDGYKQVSPLLEPTARAFVDNTGSPVTGYISFRVVAEYDDRTSAPGIERLYNYFPIRKPPCPQHVTVKNMPGDKKNTIVINWDPPMNGDTITNHFRVYVAEPNSDYFILAAEKPLNDNNLFWTVRRSTSGMYKLYVAAISKTNAVSDNCDTLTVQTASTELFAPMLTKAFADNGKVVLQWQYPDIPDLKGFRIFRNKKLIAGENEVAKNLREFIAQQPAAGACEFTITAVTENGVESDESASIAIPAK